VLLEVEISRCGYPEGFELRNVSFTLREGELLVVTGHSGSGKTTLVRAITGTIEVFGGFIEGKVVVEGRDLNSLRPGDIYEAMGYIPQEPWYALVGHTVYAEICHALSLREVSCVDTDFNPLGVSSIRERLTYTLSAGETQRVLWLETLLLSPRILILDEPLVYLDEEARRIIKHYVKVALGRGMGVILVDHNPLEWRSLEPRLLVLDKGRVKYHGEWCDDALPSQIPIKAKHGEAKGVVVKFKNTWFKYPGGDYILKGFNAEFYRGVLTLLTGPNGSGKTTVLKIGAGVLKPTKGVVERSGSVIYIPENPLLYFTMPTPREELLMASRGDENKALDVAELFNLKYILDTPLAKLSSGERRRLAIASAYLMNFDCYFIDEATGGLDDESAALVLNALQLLVEKGKAVVIASHDPRIPHIADIIINLSREG
jgi:energy-coupling factor transport system ATP-binding protein